MGKENAEKSKQGQKRKNSRKGKEKASKSSESESSSNEPSKDNNGIDKVEKEIVELREKGKEDPNIDFLKELRKIQDQISDLKGEERRPITAAPKSKGKEKDEESDVEEENGDDDNGDSQSPSDSEEDHEEDDHDKALKEMINKRLTTCMLLALSFESDSSYPRDFYEKLADSNQFKEITQPFKKEEMVTLNQLLKEKKREAKRRLKECSGSR